MFPNYLTILHDCEKSEDNLKTVDDLLSNQKISYSPIVLLLDEINLVYEHLNRDAAIRTISELALFGKEPSTYSILTGSTALLFDRAFNTADSYWRRKGFRSLNQTVFLAQRLLPIRDITEFKNYCDSVFPNHGISNYDEAFKCTGGVFKNIVDYISSNCQFDPSGLFKALDNPKFEALCSFMLQMIIISFHVLKLT
ncbi:hypothetical protein GEMRC1_009641 [Eukaryota sp. GEM-RC1]